MENEKNVYKIFAILSVIFFIGYLFLYWPGTNQKSHLILNQPDEAVNYFFIKELAVNHRFSVPEPMAEFADREVHLRSMTFIAGGLSPISFPGIIALYGFVSLVFVKIFGLGLANVSVFFTPLLAVITPILFYSFLKLIFEKRVAFLSAVLLYILPSWWYYASRPFQHNLLFIFFLILALFCGTKAIGEGIETRKKYLWSFLFGLFLAGTIFIRAAEIVFIVLLALLLFVALRKKINWQMVLWAFLGAILTMLIFFGVQNAYYGHFIGSGYVKPAVDGSSGVVTDCPQGRSIVQALFSPFGFNLKNIVANFWQYAGIMFGWWFIFTGLGIGLVLWQKIKEKKVIWYLGIFALLSAYLFVFYGSWKFSDNLLQLPSIGTSYVRYFLFFYVFSLPFVALFILNFFKTTPKKQKLVLSILLLGFFLNSVYMVYFSLEGLWPVRQVVKQYSGWQDKIYLSTESNSVIATRYADKYLFPGRKILPDWNTVLGEKAIENLLKNNVPVYWYDLSQNNNYVWQNVELGSTILTWDNLELRKIELK